MRSAYFTLSRGGDHGGIFAGANTARLTLAASFRIARERLGRVKDRPIARASAWFGRTMGSDEVGDGAWGTQLLRSLDGGAGG